MFRGEEEARQELQPYLDRMYRCVDEALNEYHLGYALLRTVTTKRSNSSIRNDMIVNKLLAEFDGDPDVTFIYIHGRYLMLVGNFVIRVKKLNKNLLSSNIQTQFVLDFVDQQYPSLPGMGSPTSLDLGYKFNNDVETNYGVFLRCPDDERNHWHIELFGGEAYSDGIVIEDSLAPTEPPNDVLARPKREEVEHAEEKSDVGTAS